MWKTASDLLLAYAVILHYKMSVRKLNWNRCVTQEVYGLQLSVNDLFVKEVDAENQEVCIQIQGKEQPGNESF